MWFQEDFRKDYAHEKENQPLEGKKNGKKCAWARRGQAPGKRVAAAVCERSSAEHVLGLERFLRGANIMRKDRQVVIVIRRLKHVIFQLHFLFIFWASRCAASLFILFFIPCRNKKKVLHVLVDRDNFLLMVTKCRFFLPSFLEMVFEFIGICGF